MMRILAASAAAMTAAAFLAACQSAPPVGGTVLDGAPAGDPRLGAGAATTPDGAAIFDPPAGPLSPEQIWRVDGQDNVTHIQSGAVCPGMLGPLRRDKQTIYKQNGMDVGCSYTGGEGPAVLRFYVFASDNGGLDAEMRVASDSMRAQQPIAKRATVASGAQAYRNFALVDTAGGATTRNSLLMTQVNGGWMLKVRLTCREADAKALEEVAARQLGQEVERLKSRPAPRLVRTPGQAPA